MAKIINFDKLTIQKNISNNFHVFQFEYEILISVIKYFGENIPNGQNLDLMEVVKPSSKVVDVFNGNELAFLNAIEKLMNYWEISSIGKNELDVDQPFSSFLTVHDVCTFFENKARSLAK